MKHKNAAPFGFGHFHNNNNNNNKNNNASEWNNSGSAQFQLIMKTQEMRNPRGKRISPAYLKLQVTKCYVSINRFFLSMILFKLLISPKTFSLGGEYERSRVNSKKHNWTIVLWVFHTQLSIVSLFYLNYHHLCSKTHLNYQLFSLPIW